MPSRAVRPDLLATLEQGVRELAQSQEWQRYLRYQSRFHRYSANNVLLIAAQCPDATQVASFGAWRAMGRAVRRGERAIWILAPILVRARDERDATELRGFRPVPVFDVSQTEGSVLPAPCVPLAGASGAEHYDALVAVARSWDFSVLDHDFVGGVHGDCDHRVRRLRVERRDPPSQRVKTLAHELAHGFLHAQVVSRAEAELEAESVAFVVCHALGIDSGCYSFGYLATWAGGGDSAVVALRAAAGRIERAARAILDALAGLDGPAGLGGLAGGAPSTSPTAPSAAGETTLPSVTAPAVLSSASRLGPAGRIGDDRTGERSIAGPARREGAQLRSS